MTKRVLVACEFSGVVRDAFAALGWDAWSCDLLPTEKTGPHLQCDVRDAIIHGNWDLLIAHPPCTYLCNSGVRWLAPGGKLNTERHLQMQEGCDLLAALYNAPIKHVCIENPVMHKYAIDYLKSAWRVPTRSQTIQPYEYGHGETKRTCLWLRNLPLLAPSHVDDDLFVPPTPTEREQRVWKLPPSPNRWKERSRTLPGIATAMATQWTNALYPHD